MRLRPFKLLNGSERARIAELAATAFDSWRQGWLADRAKLSELACDPAAKRDDLSFVNDWLSFSSNGATLYVAQGERAADVVRSAIAGAARERPRGEHAASNENTIEANLLQAALNDLARRVMGAEATRSNAAPPAETWLRGSGAACIDLPVQRSVITVIFDAALVSKLLGPPLRKATRSLPLAGPQHCIGRQPLEIGVWLGSTEIELAIFQSLAVNDVLLLDSRIDYPLRITVAGREVAPRALLGRTGSNKAVRLTTFSPEP